MPPGPLECGLATGRAVLHNFTRRSGTSTGRLSERAAGFASDDELPRYAVGVVHYRAYDALDRCLQSVAQQSVGPTAIRVIDGDADPARLDKVREQHPLVDIEAVVNRGYAGGANRLLAHLQEDTPGVEFILLLNPDVELEPEFVETLLRTLADEPTVAIASGKLLRPGGEFLDSAGIRLPANRRPRDRGSEERAEGQYNQREYVFGATGAAMMLRCSALSDLAIDGEVFDEDFFVYHEDTDLSWRANLLGWRVLYEPEARAAHLRGWQRNGRFDVPVNVRRHSFKNHYLQLIKNESVESLLRVLPLLVGWEVMRLGFALLRDPQVLPGYADAWRLRGRALGKRRTLQQRVRDRRTTPAPCLD